MLSMKSKIVNVVLIVLALTVLAVLGLYVRIGVTADSVAVLKTGGMTCSSCSSKITSALEKQKGVAATEVDVEGGWVIVGYDTKVVKPESLAEKVNQTGFVSSVHAVLTPEQFRQITGRAFGQGALPAKGCCGPRGGGCGGNRQN